MPFGHLGVNVTDLARAKHYYDELMPLLSFESFWYGPERFMLEAVCHRDEQGT